MAEITAPASSTSSQSDETAQLLREFVSLNRSIEKLVKGFAPDTAESADSVAQRDIEFAYKLLRNSLGRGADSDFVVVAVTSKGTTLTFVGDVKNATAARVRGRVDGVAEVDTFSAISTGSTVTLSFDPAAVEGIELLDAPDGAVVAVGRLEP